MGDLWIKVKPPSSDPSAASCLFFQRLLKGWFCLLVQWQRRNQNGAARSARKCTFNRLFSFNTCNFFSSNAGWRCEFYRFMSCCKPTTWAAEQPGAYKQIPIIVSTTLHPIRLIGFESLKLVIKGEYGVKKNKNMKESLTNWKQALVLLKLIRFEVKKEKKTFSEPSWQKPPPDCFLFRLTLQGRPAGREKQLKLKQQQQNK